jgi:hypothetical protein
MSGYLYYLTGTEVSILAKRISSENLQQIFSSFVLIASFLLHVLHLAYSVSSIIRNPPIHNEFHISTFIYPGY